MNYRQYKRIAVEILVLAITMRFGYITISEYYKLQKRRRALNKVLNRNHHKCHIYRKRIENEQLKKQITALEAKDMELSQNWRADHDTLVFYDEKLEEQNDKLQQACKRWFDQARENKKEVVKLLAQIKKMRCCQNCNGHCSWTSESIKDGKITSHYWNKEKQAYCDVGEGAEYQLWEIRK